MSLKAFHIVFISVSVILAFGFSLWALQSYFHDGDIGLLIAALLSFIFGIGLIVYGVQFLRKLKHVGYL